MKSLVPLLLVSALVVLTGCRREIKFTAGDTGTVLDPSPPNVTANMNRGDTVAFINQDEPVHRIVVYAGTGVMPAGLAPNTIYPPDAGPGRSSTFTWNIPAGTAPPATFTWVCVTHAGETGTITVNP